MASSTCSRCLKIQLTQNAFTHASTITLGKLSAWGQDCPMCSTWLRLAGIEEYPEFFEDEEDFESAYHIVPFNTSTLFEDPPTVLLRSWEWPVSYAVVEEENVADEDGQQLFNCVRGRGWLSPVPTLNSHAAFSARVLAAKVDTGSMKSHLSRCLKDHPACRTGFQREMNPIRLVDCTTYRVITRRTEEPYLTLSYVNAAVQEDTTRHQRDKPLSLPLPTLYEDSIQLTMKLGYNYLWIDNYCIPQEDARRPLTDRETAERKVQIRQMDQIYTRSDLTIIAAHGLPHLPGITSRVPSSLVTIGEEQFVVCPPTPAYEIENSDSNERSWCYQEATLATRRVVILNHQTYFKCKTVHTLESLHGNIHPRKQEREEEAYDLHRWNEFEVFANIASQKADPLEPASSLPTTASAHRTPGLSLLLERSLVRPSLSSSW